MNFLYLFIDFCTVIVPIVFSFHPKLNFYRNFKAFFTANLIVASIFIFWDIQFTKWGVWGFNHRYVTGIYFFNLPIEEIFFFICIPFACVFTYHCLNLFFNITLKQKTEKVLVLTISGLLLISGICFNSKLYTSVTFISLALLILFFKFLINVKWLAKLFIIYPVLLIPFFVVNGILTGTGLQEPVVWYNNSETMAIRLFTIPVEDVFYGFELILLNIFFYEYFKIKFIPDEIEYENHKFI